MAARKNEKIAGAMSGAALETYVEKVKNREMPPSDSMMAYLLLGEGEWPYMTGRGGNVYTTSAEAIQVRRGNAPVRRRAWVQTRLSPA